MTNAIEDALEEISVVRHKQTIKKMLKSRKLKLENAHRTYQSSPEYKKYRKSYDRRRYLERKLCGGKQK